MKIKAARKWKHFVTCEVHGETGDGKSRFGTTFPGPRLWLDPTHGCDRYITLHANDCPALDGADCNGCGGDFVENTINPDRLLEAWEEGLAMAHAGKIRTIIVDDASVIQDQMKLAWAEDPDEPKFNEWGAIKRPLNRILNKTKASPVNLLITSRASMVAADADAAGKIKAVHKAARPKAWDDWIYATDVSIFLYSEGSELAPQKIRYFGQVQKTRGMDDAPLKPGMRFENPTFESVFADYLTREADAPLPEYEDPTAIAKSSGTVRKKLELEQAATDFLAQIKAAPNKEVLKGVWTRALEKLPEFDVEVQEKIRDAKERRKEELQAK